jgi:O-acetyl-ADP-ribose deacetylase (regulator of RNase III)
VIVETIEGNLLDFPNGINTIAHSCNTQNVMGGGLAKQIKDRYPEVFETDRKAVLNKENSLGYFSFCKLDSNPDKRIINLYTQQEFGTGRQVSYEAFYNSIDYLFKAINSSPEAHDYVLGLPYGISCGLAGGNWNIVKCMIDEVFMPAKFKTYLVKLNTEIHA